MSSKNIAVSAAILISIVTFVALLADILVGLQGMNPMAIVAAVTVAAIGIVWFRRTNR